MAVREALARASEVLDHDPRAALRILRDELERQIESGTKRGALLLLRSIAVMHSRLGEFSGALAALERATAFDPRDSYLLLAIGDAQLKLGNKLEGRRSMERALELSTEQQDADAIELARKAVGRLDRQLRAEEEGG